MSNNSSNNSEKLRADLLNFGPDVAEKGLVGVVEVPAREVPFRGAGLSFQPVLAGLYRAADPGAGGFPFHGLTLTRPAAPARSSN